MKKPFSLLAAIFVIFIAAASAPSPLYSVFQKQWHFSAIILTIIFAVYALALLAALLFFGSVSDYIGRRPVLIVALVVEAGSMATFGLARSAAWLISARLLQGFATGLATAAISAGLIDTQPKNKPGLAPLVASITPVASLGIGAILAGFLAQYVVWPTHLVFYIIGACALAVVFGVFRMSETVKFQPGWLASLRPVVSVPRAARRSFAISSPSLIANWAFVGLFLALGPSVTVQLTHNTNHLEGGLIILVLTMAGAISSTLFAHWGNQKLLLGGASVAVIGLLLVMSSLIMSSAVLFFMAAAVAGAGFGPAFTGAFRSIMSQAPHDQRAGLAAAIYVVSYLALSIPVMAVGVAATVVNLHTSVMAYVVVTALLYLLTLGLLTLSRTKSL